MRVGVDNIWIRGIERDMVDVTVHEGGRNFIPAQTTIKYIISFSNSYIDFSAEVTTDKEINDFNQAEKVVREYWGV